MDTHINIIHITHAIDINITNTNSIIPSSPSESPCLHIRMSFPAHPNKMLVSFRATPS